MFYRRGNYVIKVRPGFRIIQYNSNYCARLNPWSLYNSVDPGDILKWLINELTKAEQEGDNVHLVGHIAPDHGECTQAWLNNFIAIIERFQDTIKAQFYGHQHRDEFRVYYSLINESIPIGYAFLAPSLTSYSKTNPAYRTYEMNSEGIIVDYETHYFNLTNHQTSKSIDWKVSYRASKLFESNQITPLVLDRFIEKLQTDDKLFTQYFR